MQSYTGPKFTREQLVFVADVMLSSAIDVVTSHLPGRYIEGPPGPEWDQEVNSYGGAESIFDTFEQALVSLGWNLSILYAQLTGDGIGTSDVLEIANLRQILTQFTNDWIAGRRGIIPKPEGPRGAGTYDVPDTTDLASQFVNDLFHEYL